MICDVVRGAFDFVLELVAGLFELAHALAEAAGEFGDLLGPEEEEDDDEDDRDLRSAEGPKMPSACSWLEGRLV